MGYNVNYLNQITVSISPEVNNTGINSVDIANSLRGVPPHATLVAVTRRMGDGWEFVFQVAR